MQTPDVNVTQILALISAVVGLFVGFGLTDNDHAQLIIGSASVIVPAVWILADSLIRHGRSRVLAAPPVIHNHLTETTSGVASLDQHSDVIGGNDPSAQQKKPSSE